MRLLVTGAAGSVGRVLGAGLSALGHELRGVDLQPQVDEAYALGWLVGDCLDVTTAEEAVQGVDAVVHLAGNPDEDALPASLESHVLTTARLLEAMVRHGVSRMVYASSNHAVGFTPHRGLVTTDVPPRPDTFYGVAKVATEGLLSLYADRHDIVATALRIGSFGERPTSTRQLSTWLSPGDAVRLVDAAVRSHEPGLRVVYGISANTRGWWDLGPGREMGYEPLDDAETYAEEISAGPDDEDEDAHVGGPFTMPDAGRPAF